MSRHLTAGLFSLFLMMGAPLAQADRVAHFEGEAAATLEAALANLAKHNPRLAELIAQETLDPQSMHDVHQLTYTLENALETLRNELEAAAEALEAVHVASETSDPDTVRSEGRQYLETLGQIAR